MRCSYQTPGGGWACGNLNAHHSPSPTLLCAVGQHPKGSLPYVATPIRLPHLTPQAENLLCYAIGTWHFIHEDGGWHVVVVMPLVRGLRLVFLWLKKRWKSGLVSVPFCAEMCSYFKLEFLSLHFILSFSVFFTLDLAKKKIFLFFPTAVYSAWRLGCPLNAAQAKWLSIFRLEISPRTLLTAGEKFCSYGSCGGEMGLAQSSLATLCITRMQMSYEAIHLLEMPPWFQFESCLQSHCVSPLLHVKEVSLCERSEGDNCT